MPKNKGDPKKNFIKLKVELSNLLNSVEHWQEEEYAISGV